MAFAVLMECGRKRTENCSPSMSGLAEQNTYSTTTLTSSRVRKLLNASERGLDKVHKQKNLNETVRAMKEKTLNCYNR